MPSRHALKVYVEGGYYHIYNRGVEKKPIFLEHRDYLIFIRFLEQYLSPPGIITADSIKNYFGKINLIAYCLMPNHFHLLVQQRPADAITGLMRSLITRYVKFFNQKYQRVGPLFQSRYKAACIIGNFQILQMSKYIHRNPLFLNNKGGLASYKYSSYRHYLDLDCPEWIQRKQLFKMIGLSIPLYKELVESEVDDTIGIIVIEDSPHR